MNKISCDSCLDLMPLVVDGISSEDSKRLVEDHIKECEECRSIYSQPKNIEPEDLKIDDQRVLSKIKKKLYSLAALILIFGTIMGVSLSDSQSFFYSFLIMPVLGGVSYLAFGKKAYLGSILVLIISFINQSIYNYLRAYYTSIGEILYDALFISIQFLIFFFIGIVIFRLLKYSLYGGGNKDE